MGSGSRRGLAAAFFALGIVLVVAGMALFAGFLFHPGYVPVTTYYYPFFLPFGWIWILFGIFVIFGLTRFAFRPWRWGGYSRRYWTRYDEPYRILRERYARGEITKEQFDQMMRDLDEHR